jgi:hypothetical protein
MQLKRFTKRELRWDFYPMFLKLKKNGFTIEASLLMLSTWNFACFRYAVREFNLDHFIKIMKEVELLLKEVKTKSFNTINFDIYKTNIKKAFTKLASIKGIQKTGTPKLIHLIAPKVFVMWDTYIRNYYGFKKGDADDYIDFLKLMQSEFPKAKSYQGRTVAKLIDEHNYKTITMTALKELESRNKN